MKRFTNMKFWANLVPVCMLALVACTSVQSAHEYVVEGTVRDSSANGKTIYIMRYDDLKNIDSTVIKDNKFVFKGTIDTAVYCRIDVTHDEFANLILEGGHIKANLNPDAYNCPSGTPMNDAMARFTLKDDSLFHERQKMSQVYRERYQDVEELNKQWDVLEKEQGWDDYDESVKRLFQEHNNDAFGYYLLYTFSFQLLSKDVQEELLISSGPWLRSQRFVKTILANIEARKKTAEGLPFTDIKGQDMDGNPIALSDFIGKGNYVLVDFWASWCGPCRGEIPNLRQLYERYHDKGLTIVGLFTWDKVENLSKAVAEERITWPQIFDTDRGATLYGVEGIPHIILFAPDGTILKRDLRGELMIKTVEDILNKR